MTLKTKLILTFLLLMQDVYAYRNVNKWRMCDENESNEVRKKEKSNEERQEEMRRWFESIGDCV